MAEETLGTGALLPVLSRATHQDLDDIVTALNKGWDVFITWDERYKAIRHDLTQNPGLVAEYILRAGAHRIADPFRQTARSYPEVVQDACRGVGVKSSTTEPDVIELESLLLKAIMERLLAKLSDVDREALEQKLKEKAVVNISINDILNGGAKMAGFLPMAFPLVTDFLVSRGLVSIGASLAGLNWLGPIVFVLGTAWVAYDLAGPSLRATVPAVACVALLRQRMMWSDLQ